MGIFNFGRDSKQAPLEVNPLEYWEENSYMLGIPWDYENFALDEGVFERISMIEDLVIKSKELIDNETVGILVQYQGIEYKIGLSCSDYSFIDMGQRSDQIFNREQEERLEKANKSLVTYMKFDHDVKESYHLQLKILSAAVPNLLAVVDESGESILNPRWVSMAALSKVVPGASSCYSVQAVSDDNGKVWLHTHGLCRCGLGELEIIESDKEHFNDHYNVLSTYASMLIDGQKDEPSLYIGQLSNGQPVVVTSLIWTEGLKEYPNNVLGGFNDRRDGHNTNTSIVFLYKNEEDENNNILTKVSHYDSLWGDNPLFFFSSEETRRMESLSRERFSWLERAIHDGIPMENVIIKIGLPTNLEDGGKDYENLEHIWFKLEELDSGNSNFKAVLLQDPYDVDDMKKGDMGEFSLSNVTDWRIYLEDKVVSPETAYMLEV